VSLEDWLGDTVVISFRHYTGGGIRCDAAFDDIYIRNESCKLADSLIVTAVTQNSASISWVAGGAYADKWDAVIVPNGNSPSTGSYITPSGTTHTFNGLSANTSYDVYIREYCENNTLATSWIGPVDAITLCGATSLPYTENFNSGMPSCFTQSTNDDFGWSVSTGPTATPNTGPANPAWGISLPIWNLPGKARGRRPS